MYESTDDKQHDLKTNSLFYQGVCAAKLDNQDAGFLLQSFIDRYPVHTSVPEAHYYLGRFYFARKNYKKVIAQFDEIYESEIQPENVQEYHFKKGYSYFMTEDYDNAKMMFRKAREEEGPYKDRSLYYLAYMAYQAEQYDAALEDFLILKDNTFHTIDDEEFLDKITITMDEALAMNLDKTTPVLSLTVQIAVAMLAGVYYVGALLDKIHKILNK